MGGASTKAEAPPTVGDTASPAVGTGSHASILVGLLT